MPRKKLAVPRISKTLQIPEDIVMKVDLLLLDPLAGKPKFGAWSELVTSLLRRWLAETAQEHQHQHQQPTKENP